MGEATDIQDFVEGVPGNQVEGFPKVEFEDHGGAFARVARAHKICCKDIVFDNVPPRNESSLITMYYKWDEGLKSRGENLGNGFDRAVLQGYGPKGVR